MCLSCGRTASVRGLCQACYAKYKKKGILEKVALAPTTAKEVAARKRSRIPLGATKTLDSGYVQEWDGFYWKPQHRLVLERELGRTLVLNENVHHINGIRDDNDLSNLELWYRAQPGGQRVKELLSYFVAHHREELETLLAATRDR